MTSYQIVLRELETEDGGGFLAEVPELPGCMSDGNDMAEAIANVQDAIGQWIATAKAQDRPIPKPMAVEGFSGKWLQRVPKSLHMRLAERAKAEGVSLNAFASALLAEGLGKRDSA